MVEKSCSPYGSQEAQREDRSGDKIPIKGTPSSDLLPPNRPYLFIVYSAVNSSIH
jgi:hypothetical protein